MNEEQIACASRPLLIGLGDVKISGQIRCVLLKSPLVSDAGAVLAERIVLVGWTRASNMIAMNCALVHLPLAVLSFVGFHEGTLLLAFGLLRSSSASLMMVEMRPFVS